MKKSALRDLRHLLSEPANQPVAPWRFRLVNGHWANWRDCGHTDCASDGELAYACALESGREIIRGYHPHPPQWDDEYHPMGPPEPARIGPHRNAVFGRIRLARVRLDRGGHDRFGVYWGRGTPLWSVRSDDGALESEIRAQSRAAAKKQMLAHYPNARFYR